MDLSMPAGTPAPPPLERLTDLYVLGGYGRQSAQLATALLAEHDAGKDTRGAAQAPAGASTLGSDVLDLLTAIRDAVDVPLPGTDDADDRAWHRLMQHRLSDLYVSLSISLDAQWVDTLDAADEAAHIRARTAATPVAYTLYEQGGEPA